MPKVAVVVSEPSFSARKENRRLTGFEQNFLYEKAARAGLMSGDLVIRTLADFQDGDASVVVTLGETAMQALTGKQSLWKWHLSPLDAALAVTQKAVPTFDFTQIWKDWQLGLYFEMALKRAAQNATSGPWIRKEERYVIGPDSEQAIAHLEAILAGSHDWYSIDIETGRCQINTFGVATSGNDAIAVKVLPEGMPPALFHKLWTLIARVCESDVPKTMQNGIYERTYLSRYGIRVNAFRHDTMCAQKFLWPELEKGLDNVGRIYTMERYWKDDARIASEAGKQKDWGNIRDWPAHFTYNCRDTSNTLIACLAQREDLARRGLLELHDNYLVRLYDCVAEMGNHGLPLSTAKQSALIAEYEARSTALVKQLSREINPRSWQAKLKLLKDKGYEIPTKRSTGKETTDELALKKLRLKHPGDRDLQVLLEVAKIEKALSSYLRVQTLDDNRIRFMMDPVSTETWRMAASMDPWGGGFNVQTLTDYAKGMIEWSPNEDRFFLDIDLSQAETRYVAYDAIEETLLGMLVRGEDVHRFVAAEIYKKPMVLITHDERQLGKKSGHAGNYGEGPRTFVENCLKEMDLVLSLNEGRNALESYHRVFPGIRRWQSRIRAQIYRDRKLVNPLGMVRYFYGRCDDKTYREAYAHNPQSTIPQITNHLMLGLWDRRTEGALDFWLHAQTHDSLTLSCRRAEVDRIATFARNTGLWHPEIILPAGRLVIPTETKFGRNLGEMQKWTT